MKNKTETNPAKKILCLALCAIKLIAMLPAMTVSAYADEEAVELVKFGPVWV